MPDSPDISPNLGLPFYQTKQNEFEVQHNEALLILDALVMLAVIDRDLAAPPASPTVGDRYIVKAPGTGDFAGKDDQIAQYDIGGWNFYAPQAGWTCYVQDEQVLLAWDGSAWAAALGGLGDGLELQNVSLLGVGTDADATNPFAAKLNNVLCVAKTVAEGGDGTLRYKLSKESAAATLSLLFQDNFSGRAEIGLTGDDDFHFKTSADGSSWTDALVLDQTTGSVKLNSGLFLSGDIAPSQITADQNDYSPAGLASAAVLRLSTDASRNITGLSGGADGRVAAIVNVGANPLVLKDADPGSSAANRFAFGADVTLAAKQSAVLWYDAADSGWKLFAGPHAAGGGGGGEVTSNGTSTTGNIPRFSDTSADVIEDSGIAAADILVDADIGVAVQAYDAELAALAGLTSAADKGIYFTGSATAALFDLAAYGRSLAAAADEAAFKAAVNLEIGTDVQAYHANLAGIAGIAFAQGDILYYDGANIVKLAAGTSGQFLKTQGAGANPVWDAPAGGGDVIGPSSSVDGEIALFDSTTGKLLKRANQSGILKASSGVLSAAAAGTDYAVPGANTDITSLYLNNTGLKLKDVDASHGLTITPGSDLTVDRTLTVNTGDASRTLTLGGDTTLNGGTHSGTNTGDQTISLTGDVTGSGTGSFAATIANGAVSYAKMQNVSATDKLLGRASAGAGDVEEIDCTAAGRALLDDADAAAQITTLGLDNSKIAAINFIIDGGGSAVTTGVKGDLEIPFACTINRATLLADQAGSIVIDIWKDSYANAPPTVADTITASAKPTLSSEQKSQDGTLTGWTASIAAGDILRFSVDSASTVTRVTLSLKVTKT